MNKTMVNGQNNTNVATLPTVARRTRASNAYKQQSRQCDQEKWILSHLPLVKHIVKRLMYNLGGKVERDDLVSAGTVGLVKAAQSFDPARGVEFKTYAYIRIRGAVIDELRSASFVPAAVNRDIRTIRETYQQITTQTGSPPSDKELARAVSLPLEKMYKVLEEARRQNFLSIHGMGEEHSPVAPIMPVGKELAPDEIAEKRETLENLAEAIMQLPKRDRQIVVLYYERDLTMKETAEVLGVTESRISQLHASALFKLSMKLGKNP